MRTISFYNNDYEVSQNLLSMVDTDPLIDEDDTDLLTEWAEEDMLYFGVNLEEVEWKVRRAW